MNHKDLDAWKQAMQLVEEVYRMSATFPDHERYGLISQVRRAAVSVPSNLSEGSGRREKKEFCNFLGFFLGFTGRVGNAAYHCIKAPIRGRLGFSVFNQSCQSVDHWTKAAPFPAKLNSLK